MDFGQICGWIVVVGALALSIVWLAHDFDDGHDDDEFF